MIKYLGAKQIRDLAKELNLKPTKKLGQNFVIDSNTCRKIVDLANISKSDLVIEIGPGLGSLTLALLDQAGHVVAVEIDKRLSDQLLETVIENGADKNRLTILNMDALQLSAADIANQHLGGFKSIKVVANLPYNISVPVIINLLENFNNLNQITVMVQTEVAQRLAAKAGNKDYGAPSAKVAWWADPKIVSKISRKVFWPEPNVDSSIIQLSVRKSLGSENLRRSCFQVIDLAFSTRRKMLRSTLSTLFGSVKSAEARLSEIGINPTLRGESLEIKDFLKIAELL